ncbi:MAG: alpha/beta hydrolase, partial [Deltaproteobacteria bacterium]|nr:alpha/beta hydrolase [Deltaproteobacteria bacterium]
MRPRPHHESWIELRDGRRLAYAEFGDRSGRPILFFHGTPGARWQLPPDASSTAARHGFRIVTVDRPGVGRSTPNHRPSLLSFARDVEQLADALAVDRFAVMGLSGGGPYALACAHEHPERIVASVSLGGVGPTDGQDGAPGFPAPMVAVLRSLWPVKRPVGAALFTALKPFGRLAHPAYRVYARLGPKEDRPVLRDPAMRAMFTADLRMAVREGMIGALYDLALFGRPWGFSPGDIEIPVRIWHGDIDPVVPLAHSEHLSTVIPDCELEV